MKYLHRLFAVASAAFFIAGSASAQNAGSVTSHAFVLGKGAGTTGYTSLLCGSAQLAVGQSAADPICRTITGDVTITAAGVTAIGTAKVTVGMIAAMTSAQLAGIVSDETGTGSVVFSASPAFTGTPTAPTASFGTNTTQLATTAFVIANAASSGVASFNGLTGAVAALSADKRVYVSTAGNDSNNGLSAESAKLTLQAAINAATPGGTVIVGAGTYTQAATLSWKPTVNMFCAPGVTITQGTAANLNPLIDFHVNTASNSSMRYCTVDGNRTNNTENATVNLVYVGDANNVKLEYNNFWNSVGNGVNVRNGLQPVVSYNDFQNMNSINLVSSTTVANTATTGMYNNNTFSNQLGQHVIFAGMSDKNQICGNNIKATQIKGFATVSGTTITWVSGTNFSGLKPGGFVVMAPGGVANEYNITAVNSSTSLTISTSGTAQTNAAFIAGTGDIISIGSSQRNNICNNYIEGGASGAVVISNFSGGESVQGTTVQGNEMYFIGGSCISIQSTSTVSPATIVGDTTITNNRMFSCGMGDAAITATGTNAISLLDFAPTTLGSAIISNNRIQNLSGAAFMTYGIRLSSVGGGQLLAGNNSQYSITNNGIFGGATTTLSAGWGTTAAVSNLVVTGNSFNFQVTPNGTGIAANPRVTVNMVASPLNQPPQMQCKSYNSASGAVLPIISDINQTATAATINLDIFYTPVAGTLIYVQCNG